MKMKHIFQSNSIAPPKINFHISSMESSHLITIEMNLSYFIHCDPKALLAIYIDALKYILSKIEKNNWYDSILNESSFKSVIIGLTQETQPDDFTEQTIEIAMTCDYEISNKNLENPSNPAPNFTSFQYLENGSKQVS